MASRVSAFQWGTTFENVVSFGWPLFSVITDHEPRAGSEWVQGVGGAEDAWLTGFDWTLSCEARWLPVTPNFYGSQAPNPLQSAISGPTGVQAFLDWARAKNAFRFVPDITTPLFYIDGCYLADPMSGGRSITASLDYAQQLKIRNPSVDFLQALRGIMFEFAPGGDVLGSGLVYTGAAGRFLDSAGLVQVAAANVLRDRHYDALRRTALFEEARTNLILRSEDFTTTWSLNQVTISANATTAPDGAVTADKLVETAVNNVHEIAQNITITAGNVVVLSGFFKAAERTQGRITALNGADFFYADFDTAGSGSITPGNSGTGGSNANKLARIVAVGNGWWYVWVSGIVNAGSTAIACKFGLRLAGAASYNGVALNGAFYWGCQGEQISLASGAGQFCPGAYIPTVGGTVPRVQDLALKAWPWSKQAMWFYAKFVEIGEAYSTAPGGTLPDIVAIGQYGVLLRTEVTGGTGGAYNFTHGNSLLTRSSGVSLSPVVGDIIELLGIVYADDSIRLLGRKNGGATTDGGQSAAGSGLSSTYPYSLQIGGEAGLAIGVHAVQALKVGAGSSVATIAAAIAA